MYDMKVKSQTKRKPMIIHKIGKWIPKKTKSEILLCVCGNKYIKTRPRQVECILCISKKVRLKEIK